MDNHAQLSLLDDSHLELLTQPGDEIVTTSDPVSDASATSPYAVSVPDCAKALPAKRIPKPARKDVRRMGDLAEGAEGLEPEPQPRAYRHDVQVFGYLEDDTKSAIISNMREREKNPIDQEIAERFHNTGPEVQAAVSAILKIGEKG